MHFEGFMQIIPHEPRAGPKRITQRIPHKFTVNARTSGIKYYYICMHQPVHGQQRRSLTQISLRRIELHRAHSYTHTLHSLHVPANTAAALIHTNSTQHARSMCAFSICWRRRGRGCEAFFSRHHVPWKCAHVRCNAARARVQSNPISGNAAGWLLGQT